ncbi:hypothetical protein D5086_022706 [Populus alba]|uniref:Uncharacterized protein n=2 Tax=Populus TaxID=3689 RepID=A0ACC4BFR6_POPAL|nr:hypothetical protein NC653_028375 [Populus alba x Populus x berolinensis]
MTPTDDSLCVGQSSITVTPRQSAGCRQRPVTGVPDMQELECNYSMEKTKSRGCRNFQQSHGRRNLSSKVGGTSPCERRICSSINSAARGSLQAATAEEEREFPPRKRGRKVQIYAAETASKQPLKPGKTWFLT